MNPSKKKSVIKKVPNLIRCEVCEQVFDNDALLRKHMPRHRVACQMCLRHFNNLQSLRRHLRATDWDEAVRCCGCKLRYASMSELSSHDCIDKWPYYCGHCLKGFGNRVVYEEHMVLHAGLDPYYCRFCGKVFIFENALIRHEKFTHAVKMHQENESAGFTRTSYSDPDISTDETTFTIVAKPDAVDHGSDMNSIGLQPGTSEPKATRKSSRLKPDVSKTRTNITKIEESNSKLIKVILDVTDGSGNPRYRTYEPRVTRRSTKLKTEASKRISVSKPKPRKSEVATGILASTSSTSNSETGVSTPVINLSTPWMSSPNIAILEVKNITNTPLSKENDSNLEKSIIKSRVSGSKSPKMRTETEIDKTQDKTNKTAENNDAVEVKKNSTEKKKTKAKEVKSKIDKAKSKRNESETKTDITKVKGTTKSKSNKTRIKRSLTETQESTADEKVTTIIKRSETEPKRNIIKVKDATKVKNDTPKIRRGKTAAKKAENNATHPASETDGTKLERKESQAARNESEGSTSGLKADPVSSESDGLDPFSEQGLPEIVLDSKNTKKRIKPMETDKTNITNDTNETKSDSQRYASSNTKKEVPKVTKDTTTRTRSTSKSTRDTTKTKKVATEMKEDITKSKIMATATKKGVRKAKEDTTESKDSSKAKNPTKVKKGTTKAWELKLSESESQAERSGYEEMNKELDDCGSKVEPVIGESGDLLLQLEQNLPETEQDSSSKEARVKQQKREATSTKKETSKVKKTVAKSTRGTATTTKKDATKSSSSEAKAKKDINKTTTKTKTDTNKDATKSKNTVKGSRVAIGPKISEKSDDGVEMDINVKESDLLMSESSDLSSYLEHKMPGIELDSSNEDNYLSC